ncbi:uncharacterized protein METZ01_LOCUS77321, partial [marine metagenome]
VLEHEIALQLVEPLQHRRTETHGDDLRVRQKVVLDSLESTGCGSA